VSGAVKGWDEYGSGSRYVRIMADGALVKLMAECTSGSSTADVLMTPDQARHLAKVLSEVADETRADPDAI
jgi:hypothetical protein